MLIDTGSTVSMMNLPTWNRLKQNGMKLRASTTKLIAVNGGAFKSHRRRDIPVQIGNFQRFQDMEIGDCQDEVILGIDFLKKHVTAMDLDY